MEAKFKEGDRVTVSSECRFELGGREPSDFHGRSGVIVGVFEYGVLIPDYDVIIDNHPDKTILSCPAFNEQDLYLEASK